MMQEEFESRIEATVTADDYRLIEYVYTWHPAIDAVKGKDQVAALYKMTGGMEIIKSMLPMAKKAEAFQQIIDAKRSEMERVTREYHDLLNQLRTYNF